MYTTTEETPSRQTDSASMPGSDIGGGERSAEAPVSSRATWQVGPSPLADLVAGAFRGQHVVLDRDVLQKMSPTWQRVLTDLLAQYAAAAAGALAPTSYFVCPGQERRVDELDARERAELGIARNVDDLRQALSDVDYLVACEDITYWDEQGRELQPADRVVVPVSVEAATPSPARGARGHGAGNTFGGGQW